MIINIGDKVTVIRYGVHKFNAPVHYEVIDMWDCELYVQWFKVKHPDIGGYFTVKLEDIEEVIDEK